VTLPGEVGIKITMNIAIMVGVAAVAVLDCQVKAQTNVTPTIRTNFITAAQSFREVNGKLYNSERSILWTNFQGECLKVLTNGLVISTFTMEPVYQMGTTTRFIPGVPGAPGRHEIVPEKVQVGENKVLGRKIILQNYPAGLFPAVGQSITFRSIRVGTSDFNGDTLELWDYGTPHVVMVVTTNYPRDFKLSRPASP